MIIRRATETDEAALSRICLLTADAGQSAEALHDFGELPGFCYAVPYIKLPTTWAFVLVDEGDNAVGYVVGSTDTRTFEKYAAEHWYPALAEKYPPSRATKPADIRYTNLLRHKDTAPEANVHFSYAHLHINILPEYQRQGWGRRLIGVAVSCLKDSGFDRVWLGIDLRNEPAKLFYARLGFKPIEGAQEGNLGLKFEDFV